MSKVFEYIKNANVVDMLIMLILLAFIPSVLFKDYVALNLALPTDWNAFLLKPWTVLTYGFIHKNFIHLFSNILILFYLGNIFIDFLGSKKLFFFYFSGMIIGGIAFLMYYKFSSDVLKAPLVGASAAVTAVFIGLAVKVPNYALQFRFIGSIKLWILAVIWIFLSVLALSGVEAGAAVSHLGGALTGAIFTLIFGAKNGNKREPKKKKFKKIYRNPEAPNTKLSYRKNKENQEQVDALLDKISKSGYDSLSQEEKEFLFNQREP